VSSAAKSGGLHDLRRTLQGEPDAAASLGGGALQQAINTSGNASSSAGPAAQHHPEELSSRTRSTKSAARQTTQAAPIHTEERSKMLSARIPLSLHQDLEEVLLRAKRHHPDVSTQRAVQVLIEMLRDDPATYQRFLTRCGAREGR